MKPLFTAIMIFCSLVAAPQTPITVADGSFKVPGLSEENLYFGFAAGDQVNFTLREQKGKDIKEIELIEYPGTSRYIEFKKSKINKSLTIAKDGIYQFRFSNGALGGRICKYKIERTPASEETASFNTTVYWETRHDTTYVDETETYLVRDEYITQTILPFTENYVNSKSNEDFKGGKARITVPVSIPPNTEKWYYTFSASRNEEDIAKVRQTFSLASKLTALIDQTGTLGFGVNMISQPPGSDYCDVYLLDHDNSRLFEGGNAFKYFTVGSRENIKSGVSEIAFGAGKVYYIGFRNTDYTHGINTSLEVVAIVHEQEYVERTITVPKIRTYKVPYLRN